MKHNFLGFLAVAALVPGALMAQQVVQVKPGEGIALKTPAVETQKTPNFQAGDVKSKSVKSPRDWLEVEVEFEPKDVEPRDGVIPELLFKYYVAIRTDEGTKVLTGDVTHVNVVAGESVFSSAYVSPTTLGKITGDYRRFQTSAVQGVGVEVFYKGVSVGGTSTAGGRFWETLAPEPGVIGKNESPFALLWIDRYADVKAPGS